MHDALLKDLSKIGALKVISRRSVMRYKGAEQSIPQIARELGVNAVIEGSVLRVADRVRITVQLIDGTSDEHLWAESYERDLRDVLALQTELARTIASEIHVALTPEDTQRLASARKVNPRSLRGISQGPFSLVQALTRPSRHRARVLSARPGKRPPLRARARGNRRYFVFPW